jgi:hypothetical protein
MHDRIDPSARLTRRTLLGPPQFMTQRVANWESLQQTGNVSGSRHETHSRNWGERHSEVSNSSDSNIPLRG